MAGIKIYQDFDGYYAEHDDPQAVAAVFKVGSNREEATRNAIKRYKGPIGYLTGDGVDEKVAEEFNLPVRD
jgi:hypothetical protein